MKPLPIKNKKTGEITSYQIRVFVKTDENKKKIIATKNWKPVKKYTEKQLEKELLNQTFLFEQELKISRTEIPKNQDTYTFKEFSQKWINEYVRPNLKARTVQGYETMLKRMNEGMGDIPIDKLTPIHINKFLLNLREKGVKLTDKSGESGLSDKSVKNYYSLFSAIFSTAAKWKVISENPTNGVEPPRVKKTQVKSLEKDDVIKLFSLLENEPLKYNLYIKLAILSGMRRGEMMGLKWDCIDFENRLIKISITSLYTPEKGIFEDTTKTEGSERTIKLSAKIFDLLKVYKQQQDEKKTKLENQWIDKNYIFTQWNGEPMHPNTPYTWFIRFQEKHGLEHCSIHMLRHTTATLLIMDGANIKLVSGRLGHSNTSTTTNIYTSYLKSADEMASDALDDILGLTTQK